MTSFNAFGQTARDYKDLHVPVWLGNVTTVPVGGVLAKAFIKKGAHYPAGTSINITDGVITPVLAYKIKSTSTNTHTVSPVCNIMPEKNDKFYKLGDTFDATITAQATAVAVKNGDIEITVELSGAKQNDVLILGDKVPNAYLYNDIYIGDLDTSLDTAGATGAAVMFHSEGILIDRTPAADVAAQMAAAVPGVLQVNG